MLQEYRFTQNHPVIEGFLYIEYNLLTLLLEYQFREGQHDILATKAEENVLLFQFIKLFLV
jgi:hypothetical protein